MTGGKEILDMCKDVNAGSYVVCLYNGRKIIGIIESSVLSMKTI